MERQEQDRGDFAKAITGGGLFAAAFILVLIMVYMITSAGT